MALFFFERGEKMTILNGILTTLILAAIAAAGWYGTKLIMLLIDLHDTIQENGENEK